MSDDDNLGPIHVEMGSKNIVGHIGHKITFQAPPPSPNAIWQRGKVVGEIGADPIQGNGTYSFATLFLEPEFAIESVFEVQGVRLMIENYGGESCASLGGRPPVRTLYRVICRIE